MDSDQLVKNLSPYQFGAPQRSGVMTVLPLFMADSSFEGRFVGPLSGLKLSKVYTYGKMELSNPSEAGIGIVPLHMGYIQDKAQNHALCRSAFLSPGQKLVFEDACCVQASQGGYLEEKQQWFFILPLQLRLEALKLRGKENYSKLWEAIAELNKSFGLGNRGHLELIVSQKRAFLTQYQSRFELLPGQRGAMFFIGDRFVGLEIAPTPAYFAEVWMALICFAYGIAAMYHEQQNTVGENSVVIKGDSLVQLKERLQQTRLQRQQEIIEAGNWFKSTLREETQVTEEERFLELRLHTLMGKSIAGQYVAEDGKLVYASLFANQKYF